MSITLNKQHRTALFIRVNPAVNTTENVERREALVKSLNRAPNVVDGGTIKTDIYTVQGKTVTAGLQDCITDSGPTPLSAAVQAELAKAGYTATASAPAVKAPTGRIDSPTLRNAAKAAGYTQVAILDSL